ncbi:MAG: Rho termination factor N-terminal domain-containing protein [Mariprofundaceae bacterium]
MSKDVRMTKKGLIDQARMLGLKNVQKLRKTELIHEIQISEGNNPCFQRIPDCAVSPCMFRRECIA